LRFEDAVPQKSADEVGCLILPNSQNDQAVPAVAKRAFIKAQITGEECRSGKREQEGKDLFIGHAFAAQIQADLSDWNTPTPQHLSLAFQDILIEDVHIPGSLSQFMGVLSKGFTGQTDRLTDRRLSDIPTPLFDYALPGHSAGHLLQHVRHQYPGASECGVSVANPGIADDVPSDPFPSHTWLSLRRLGAVVNEARRAAGRPCLQMESAANSER
jgi:hypothetical protein